MPGSAYFICDFILLEFGPLKLMLEISSQSVKRFRRKVYYIHSKVRFTTLYLNYRINLLLN